MLRLPTTEELTMKIRPIQTLPMALLALAAAPAFAQTSPFSTGATAFQTDLLTTLTPVAVIAVMGLGVAAWFNRISWGWALGGAMGILLVFGAPQVVTWIRTLGGV
jgi:type IV secretion system protein VirB2